MFFLQKRNLGDLILLRIHKVLFNSTATTTKHFASSLHLWIVHASTGWTVSHELQLSKESCRLFMGVLVRNFTAGCPSSQPHCSRHAEGRSEWDKCGLVLLNRGPF